MVSRRADDTGLRWVPTHEQSRVIDALALGYSQNAAARTTGVPYQTINDWVSNSRHAAEFRAIVEERMALFNENLTAIEQQQVVQATALVGMALSGEMQRDARGNYPLEYVAAVELLRATRWRQIAGEKHRQFGESA